MLKIVSTVIRNLITLWEGVDSRIRQNMRFKSQDKLSTTTNESYSSDSGFADDEALYYISSDNMQYSSTQTRYRDSEPHSEDCELNDNDFVLDSDLKNQQRITLMSLLYSRALERRLHGDRAARKPSYSINKKDHVRKKK